MVLLIRRAFSGNPRCNRYDSRRGFENTFSLQAEKTYILTHNGVEWLPEYEGELQQIDQELALLRPLVDAEHAKRKGA